MGAESVIERMDEVVDDFARRARYFREPMTPGRARTFVRQHRLNTRRRNSVLKLRVATNCPIWDLRVRIIAACAEEVIADHAPRPTSSTPISAGTPSPSTPRVSTWKTRWSRCAA